MLLAMMRLDSRAYGVLIVLEMEKQTGCSIAPSAVYVTLRRLEKKGLLTSSMVPTGVRCRSIRFLRREAIRGRPT